MPLREAGGCGALRAQGGCAAIGEGDLSEALGYPRRYDHPEIVSAMKRIAETCHKHKVIVGNPHVGAKNVSG